MKQWLLLAALLQFGCGSITPSLKNGTGFYSELPKQDVEVMSEKLIHENFQLRSLH